MTPRPEANQFFKWFIVTVCALWLSVLLHEAGHFLPSLALFPNGDPRRASAAARSVVYGGGPIVTLVMIAWALWSVARVGPATQRPSPGQHMFAIPLGIGAASRVILITSFALRGSWKGDETALASVTGLSKWVFLLPELAVAIFATLWLLTRVAPSRARIIVAVLLGVVVGWATTLVLGPMLGLPI